MADEDTTPEQEEQDDATSETPAPSPSDSIPDSAGASEPAADENQAAAPTPAAPAQAEAPTQPPEQVTNIPAPPEQGGNLTRAQLASYMPSEGPQMASAGPITPQDTQAMMHDDALYHDDQMQGKISPKTYKDLYANKSTLGKIGTMFGLLLGGAGSGLTGQPNQLLEMMNKEIDRDLESQKTSAANKQNFLNLSIAHEQQKVAAQTAFYQNQLTQAIAKNKPLEAKEIQSRIEMMHVDAYAKGLEAAKTRMQLGFLDQALKNGSNLPPGPVQSSWNGALNNVISPALQQDIQNRYGALSAKSQLMWAANGKLPSPGQPQGLQTQDQQTQQEQAFQQQQKALRAGGMPEMAKDAEDKHVPGIQGQASIPLSSQDREQINSGQTFLNQLQRFQDWSRQHSGSIDPKVMNEGKAMAAGLQGAYRQATHGGVYKAGEQDFISQIIDSDPTKFFNQIRVAPQLAAVSTDAKAQLDQFLKSKGFQGGYQPPVSVAAPQKQAAKHMDSGIKMVGGVKYKRGPNGEAIRVP